MYSSFNREKTHAARKIVGKGKKVYGIWQSGKSKEGRAGEDVKKNGGERKQAHFDNIAFKEMVFLSVSNALCLLQ